MENGRRYGTARPEERVCRDRVILDLELFTEPSDRDVLRVHQLMGRSAMDYDTDTGPVFCRVCGLGKTRPFPAAGILYHRCRHCAATFMATAFLPSPEAERNRYEQHRNDPDDPGYRRFLYRTAGPLLDRLWPECRGLDFGCGPVSAMARIMEANGHFMDVYDPFFAPDETVLERTYDFITCTEVAEHFHYPEAEFERLCGLLNPGGYLAFMTCFQTDDEKFANWHYRRDFTHVVFYREETFGVIARQRGWELEIPEKDVVLLRRP